MFACETLEGICSPSPRKAWIETHNHSRSRKTETLAFPPEGVD